MKLWTGKLISEMDLVIWIEKSDKSSDRNQSDGGWGDTLDGSKIGDHWWGTYSHWICPVRVLGDSDEIRAVSLYFYYYWNVRLYKPKYGRLSNTFILAVLKYNKGASTRHHRNVCLRRFSIHTLVHMWPWPLTQWPWKSFQKFPLTCWIFMPSLIEIPLIIKEKSRHLNGCLTDGRNDP